MKRHTSTRLRLSPARLLTRLATTTLLTCVTGFCAIGIGAQTITSNSTGTHEGFYYSFWKDSGDASLQLMEDGRYTTQWSNATNSWYGGKGWNPGGPRVVSYSGNFNTNNTQNAHLGLYGWTTDPFVEYYIVESYGAYNPSNCAGVEDLGSVESDGATYTIRRCQRNGLTAINQTPSQQFYSVRTPKKDFGDITGTITVANHFNAWSAAGMELGTHQWMILATEGYQSGGSSDITVSEGLIMPESSSSVSSSVESSISSITSSSSSAFAAQCTYEVSNDWGSGFAGSIHIINNGDSPINGWQVSWSYDQNTISSIWNAHLSGSYVASDMGWNSIIQPGQSLDIGFIGSTNGSSVEIPVVTGDVCGGNIVSSSSSSPISSSSSNSVSTSSQGDSCELMCQWYQDAPRPLCQNQASGWGWENGQTCIGQTTCENQYADGGVINNCPSSASSSVFSTSSSSSGSVTPSELTFNEVVSSNDGVAIDETGQTEDWLELVNRSDATVNLSHYAIADSANEFHTLPNVMLQANQVILFWADDDTDDGVRHLPFKLSSDGETLTLKRLADNHVEQITVPPLATNQSIARFPDGDGPLVTCRYTSPNKSNGEECASRATPTVTDDIEFEAFPVANWPVITPQSLGLNRLAILPAEFIEVKNFSDEPLNLANYRLVLAAYPPTAGLPPFEHPSSIDLPNITLASGEIWTQAIDETTVSAIRAQSFNEGIAVLFDKRDQQVVDNAPFMHWPQSSLLSRSTQFPYRFRFCENPAQETDDCEALPSRAIGDRLRGIYTPNDFTALADGDARTNLQSVKFIIDLHNDAAIHLVGARVWPLHYTFVREIIDQDPPLNRCDDQENQLFYQGWATFSTENYFNATTRRYHLGTLTKHPNANLKNVEFTFGDEITANQMRDTFFWMTALMPEPFTWSLRPQETSQVNRVRDIESTLPIVGPKAPFINIVYQGLAPGVAFGTLTYVATDDLPDASLGNRVIVITNDVPNDIDFVAGLITEAFQTPLAHVNILSQSRNTPNMALPGASDKSDIAALLGMLVRLEVNAGGYSLRAADLAEAQAFWEQQNQQKDPLIPRLDTQTPGLVDLRSANISDIPTIGAKAAQMAELFLVNQNVSQCNEGAEFTLPDGAFAIPMSHYLEHMQASGTQSYIDDLLQDELFLTDLNYRKTALQTLQQMIMQYPANADLVLEVETWVAERFGNKRVRFRSSSNTEDLQEFNGAGLYTSTSAELDDDERPVDLAIKTVWASLWNTRAFEERYYANVDQSAVAMAVLVHRAFTKERANGVAVARNILSPTRIDQYYFNSQAGEASVTNPAPGIVTEELIYQWPPRTPRLTYHSFSNLLDDTRVITSGEIRALACSMSAIQQHFSNLLDPQSENRWFTMESEFKFLGEERTLLIKQARPFKIRELDIPNDCRDDV